MSSKYNFSTLNSKVFSTKARLVLLSTAIAMYIAPTQTLAQSIKPNLHHLQLVNERTLLVPTSPTFAKPFKFPKFPKSVNKGILTCDFQIVANSPETCIVRNMPLIQQTDPRIDADVKDMGGFGCYDTSILTVILTSIANLKESLPSNQRLSLTGRVKELNDIKADEQNSIPKEIKQLSWFYRVVKEAQKQAKTPNPTVFPLYFPEVLASFNNGKVNEQCNAYKYATADSCAVATNSHGNSFRQFSPGVEGLNSWTDGAVTQKMKDGYILLIAYGRYKPVFKVVDGKSQVTFEKTSQHKVVFSGFQHGEYPLMINDVGNAQQYRVRLSNNLAPKLQKSGQSSAPQIIYPTAIKSFLEYEGDASGQVFFVEHIDGLKLSNK